MARKTSSVKPAPQENPEPAARQGLLGLGSWKEILWNLVLMTAGNILAASAVNGILIPHQFVSGGVVGVALGVHYLIPVLPVAWLYLLLNVPLFLMGWAFVGRRFFIYSIFGMVVFSVCLQWVHVPMPVQDKILSALLAGIIIGTGSGIVLRSWGSAGGTDILSVMLMNRFSVRMGTTVLAFNSMVLIAASFLFSLDKALYTLVYLFVASHMINVVVTGLSQRKALFIISRRWEEISGRVLVELRRGVTLIRGQGGYTGQEEQILYTVISFHELPRIKRIIRQVDPEAFVVVHDTLEVMGHRIGNQPHW